MRRLNIGEVSKFLFLRFSLLQQHNFLLYFFLLSGKVYFDHCDGIFRSTDGNLYSALHLYKFLLEKFFLKILCCFQIVNTGYLGGGAKSK